MGRVTLLRCVFTSDARRLTVPSSILTSHNFSWRSLVGLFQLKSMTMLQVIQEGLDHNRRKIMTPRQMMKLRERTKLGLLVGMKVGETVTLPWGETMTLLPEGETDMMIPLGTDRTRLRLIAALAGDGDLRSRLLRLLLGVDG